VKTRQSTFPTTFVSKCVFI